MDIIFYLLIFTAVVFGVMGLLTLSTASRVESRVQDVLQAPPGGDRPDKKSWIKTVVQLVGPFARLSAPDIKWETSPLRLKFIRAGIRNNNAPLIFFGMKTLLPLFCAGLAYLGLQLSATPLQHNNLLLVLLLTATLGCYLPNLILLHVIRQRRLEIFNSFPDAADLMLICVEAGLGLDAALVRVAEEIQIRSVALAQEIHLTNLETRAGISRGQALHNLGQRTNIHEISTFASMLSQSDKFGTSVGESLRIFSDDLRHKRQMRAEELAAKVSTKMLFPLVFCIFPAISMVVLGPAAIRIWHVILPMMGGAR